MREALGPEIGSDVVQAAGEVVAPPPSRRKWLILAILAIWILIKVAVLVLKIVAVVVLIGIAVGAYILIQRKLDGGRR